MIQDRPAAVRALLATMCDWEPGPPTTTGRIVAQSAHRGEAPGETVECSACEGTGRLRSGLGRCRPCRGAGRITRDPYTRQQVSDPVDLTHATRDEIRREYELAVKTTRVRCDRCAGRPHPARGCPGCAGTGTVEVVDERATDASIRHLHRLELVRAGAEAGEDWLDLALRRKRELWAHGSYWELDVRLRVFESEHPRAYALTVRHLVRPEPDVVASARVLELLEWSLEWLAAGLPYPIRVPDRVGVEREQTSRRQRLRGSADRHARSQRDATIRALHHAGAEATAIAGRFLLTERRVRQIVNGDGQAAVASGPAA